jgi:RNA polymerase sigma factor (sigma-70 family)
MRWDARDAAGFCEALHPSLYGSLLLYCGSREVAEDLTQETLLRVWRHWSTVSVMSRPDRWALRVAFNLAKSGFRRLRIARRVAEHSDPGRLAFGAASDPTDAIAVRCAVATLPPRQRAAVVLRYFNDLSVADTAEILGCAQAVTTLPPGLIPSTTTTTIPGARAPQIGDFTGTLTASGTTVHVGEGVDLELRIHNASSDVINTSRDEIPTLELYCDVMQNPGPPKKTGVAYYDGWYLPESTMQPGADGVITGQFVPSTDFIGRASCQAVVMQLPLPRFFPEWDAITAIDPVVITVLPAEGATTTTAKTLPPTSSGVPPTS